MTRRVAAMMRNATETTTFAMKNGQPVNSRSPLTRVEKPSEPRSAVRMRATPTPRMTHPLSKRKTRVT